MRITINPESTPLDPAPATKADEIAQNIRVLIGTVKCDIPLARDMGIDAEYLHKPQPVAETLLYQSIADAIDTYEPRAELVGIEYTEDAESGVIKPVVEVEIIE